MGIGKGTLKTEKETLKIRNFTIMASEATIPFFEEIPLLLSTTDKVTGQPVASVLSNVQWSQDNNIGEIIPDPTDPSKAIYKPSKVGTTHITATATVTIS